jgi:hypothetical protein
LVIFLYRHDHGQAMRQFTNLPGSADGECTM